MDKFINYLNKIERLVKIRGYNEAWALANKALMDLVKDKDEMWFMIYYQMAIILAKEKKWQNALEKMGYMIHYSGGLGGITHERFILRLLKKFKKENKLNEYIKLAIENKPENFGSVLSKFIS